MSRSSSGGIPSSASLSRSARSWGGRRHGVGNPSAGLAFVPVAYSALADAVVIVHFGFVAFVALGGFLAWRWHRLVWSHIAAVMWAVGSVTVGYDCPLTPLEKQMRRWAGEGAYTGGFVDRYIEEAIYPERYTSLVRVAIAAAVLVAWAGLAMVHHPGPGRRIPSGVTTDTSTSQPSAPTSRSRDQRPGLVERHGHLPSPPTRRAG